VTFSDPNNPFTTVNTCDPGTYVLRLSASDSQLTSNDDVTVSFGFNSSITLVSGGGDGAFGTLDSANQFTQDGGATFHNAYVIEPHPNYGALAGTRWINRNPSYWAGNPGDFFVPNSTTRYRTTFTIPADATAFS
jgi:hypothetical protein